MSATSAAFVLYPHLHAWLWLQTKRAKSLIRCGVAKIGSLIWSARDFIHAKDGANGR